MTGDASGNDGAAWGGAARGRVLILACGALTRELLAIRAANGWDHVDVRGLPAIFHNAPARIAPALRERIALARPRYGANIFVAYAECGAQGAIDALCAEEGVTRIPGPHCYAVYSGVAQFLERAETEITSFYLTDYLVDHFDALIWRGFRLDRRPEMRDILFAHYRTLVYLAQTDDPARDAAAADAARRLGLGYERRATGMGDLAAFVADAAAGRGPPPA